MYLSELIIINFRSCRNLHFVLENDYPNVLIGINDCGKSTVLQAIGLLLSPKPKFNFASEDKKKNDISNTPLAEQEYLNFFISHHLPPLPYSRQESIFIGKFVVEPSDINENNEQGLSNHLKWVLSDNPENSLWLARVFYEETKSFKTYLLTKDVEEPLALYREKDTALTKRKNELAISNEEITNINRVGRFRNIELINAIYGRYDLTFQWGEYTPDKNFWVEYRYLDWNITLEQLTQFANDVVNSRIQEQVRLASSFARQQATQAQEIVNQELASLANELRADLQNIRTIQANVNFQVNSSITDLMVDKQNSDGPVHLDSQGDGVKRQLWFALIKWNAFTSIQEGITDTKFIWCFDEPETHLYPKAQREFFEIIKRVSVTNVQSIISTHSTVFIDRAKLRTINKVDLSDGYTLFSRCNSVDDIFASLQIKNSDFLFYDKFIVVEGDTEQALISHLYEHAFNRSLLSDNIQLINLGGKDKRRQNQRILQSIIEGFRKETSSQIIYIFDKDAIADFTSHELATLNHVLVGRQDIEDSIHADVWISIINEISNGEIIIENEEISAIKQSITEATPNNTLQSSQKFYKQFERLIRRKAENAQLDNLRYILPGKGIESGRLIARHISDLNQIDPSIQLVFSRLQA